MTLMFIWFDNNSGDTTPSIAVPNEIGEHLETWHHRSDSIEFRGIFHIDGRNVMCFRAVAEWGVTDFGLFYKREDDDQTGATARPEETRK